MPTRAVLGACLSLIVCAPAIGQLQFPDPVVLQTDSGRYSSLKTGPAGTLHLAFYDYVGGDLRYGVRSASGGWTFETVDAAGDVGWFASLQVGGDGVPHIAYCQFTPYRLKYAVRGPGGWAIETVDSATGRGWYSSLALDSAGNPRIAYSGNAEWDLRIASYAPGAGWQFRTLDSAGDVGLYSALALTTDDRARISYFDKTNKCVKFAWEAPDGTWTTEVIDDPGDAGIDTTIALDDDENPHVAYWDRGGDALRYSWFDGSDWHSETVEAGTDCGYEASIAWRGGPCISYEGTLGVRYAEKAGAVWQFWQVDHSGCKCGDTALALEDGLPRIAYLNLGTGDLCYAEGYVPEPAAILLLSAGLGVLCARRAPNLRTGHPG
jgi:hypothetical protein